MKKRSDNKTRVFNNILAIAGLAAVMLLCMLSCSGGVDVTEQDRVLTSFSLTWPSGFDNTCLSNEPVTVIIKALDQNGTHFTGWSGSVDIELTNASVDVTPAAVNLTAGIVERSIAFDNTSSEDQETGMTLSAEGVVTDLDVTVLVYTAEAAAPSGFGLAWPSGFDYTCASNEPLDVTVEALDQNGDLLDWSGSVDLVPTNTNVTVNPSTVNLASGTVQASIAFRNDTVQSQETVITLTDGNTVTELPDTVLVYETIPPSDVEDFEAVPWDGQIGLSWTNPPELDFTGVRILRSTSGPPANAGDGVLVYEGADEEYVDTGLTNGTTYYYTAFSHDYAANYSNGVTKNGTPSGHSVGVRAFPGNGEVTLYWDEDTGADSYTVYYTDDGTDPGPSNYAGMIRDMQDTEYEVGELSNFTAYKFTIKAVKDGMEAQESKITRTIPPGNIVAAGDRHTAAVKDDGTVWAWGNGTTGQLGNGEHSAAGNSDTPVQVLGEGGEGVLNGTAAVAAGENHTVALKNDGTVWTFGSNNYGQLGKGNRPTDSDTPVQVVDNEGADFLTDIVEVAAGSNNTVALRNDGTVWAWGNNEYGQLGNGAHGTDAHRDIPVQVVGENGEEFFTNVIAVAAGPLHTVALKDDGTVWTWGYNLYGQLGDGTSGEEASSDTPVQVLGMGGTGFLTEVIAVSATYTNTVALRNDGTVWAWGYNFDGQLGNGTYGIGTESFTPVQVVGEGGEGVLNGVLAIASGMSHTAALKNDGTVWTWGDNDHGQLGNGNMGIFSDTPIQVVGVDGEGILADITALASGTYHCITVKGDGTVWTWGWNNQGQLGNGTHGVVPTNYNDADSDTPVKVVKVLRDVTETASSTHNAAVKDVGTVYTWGYNYQGQLGDGNYGVEAERDLPVQVLGGESGTEFLGDITKVATGQDHTVALKDDGIETTVWTWGLNNYGQLGKGTHHMGDRSVTPVQVVLAFEGDPLTGITAVAAGGVHTIAIKEDKTVWTWGLNYNGQLGNGNHGADTESDIPVQVLGGESGTEFLEDIVAVAAGSYHTVALKDDGIETTVWTWGNNRYGQLGNGTHGVVEPNYDDADNDTPVQVLGGESGTEYLEDIVAIAAGNNHTVAVKDNGTVWTWGWNDHGQLGNGTHGDETDSDTPVQVKGAGGTGFLTDIMNIAAGVRHIVAIDNNGNLWTWGCNIYGQLGNGDHGDEADSDTPVQVAGGLTDVVDVSAGGNATLALQDNGDVWSWGWNYYGQLGDGNKGTDSDTPVPLSFLYLGWND